jgi:hypothetical protein
MRATLPRLAFISLCMLALLLLLYALGGSDGRRRRFRDATRLVFGEASVQLIGSVSPVA